MTPNGVIFLFLLSFFTYLTQFELNAMSEAVHCGSTTLAKMTQLLLLF